MQRRQGGLWHRISFDAFPPFSRRPEMSQGQQLSSIYARVLLASPSRKWSFLWPLSSALLRSAECIRAQMTTLKYKFGLGNQRLKECSLRSLAEMIRVILFVTEIVIPIVEKIKCLPAERATSFIFFCQWYQQILFRCEWWYMYNFLHTFQFKWTVVVT